MTQSAETQPAHSLMPFLLAVLTPFLVAGGIPDPGLARLAAIETILAYKAAGNDQLMTTAQIVTFAFASLENLRLSAPPDLSLSMKLKLRGSATALNRASHQAAATLGHQRADTPSTTEPERDPAEIHALLETAKTLIKQAQATEPATPPAPNPPEATPLPRTREDANEPNHARQSNVPRAAPAKGDTFWAGAMTNIADEYTAELPNLSPGQRQTHLARIGALSKIATMLGRGEAPPLKTRLLGSTAMQG